MNARWDNSGLPHEGQSVEFLLDDRKIPIDGTYARQAFQSRWSGYPLDRVRSWRSADMTPQDRRDYPQSTGYHLASA